MTVKELFDLLSSGGLIAGMLLWGWMGLKKLWVWGWSYDDLRRDRDEWKRMALKGTRLAEVAVSNLEVK